MKRLAVIAMAIVSLGLTAAPAGATQPAAHCTEKTKVKLYTIEGAGVYQITSYTVRCRGQIVYGEAHAVLVP